MSLNQYAVYQLKMDESTRPLRNKSYKHVLEKHITVVSDNYIQVYQTPMVWDSSPEEIRGQLEKKLPSKFKGTRIGCQRCNCNHERGRHVGLLSRLRKKSFPKNLY